MNQLKPNKLIEIFNWIKAGLIYHNAFTQTGPLIEQMKYANHITRDTQTAGFQVIGSHRIFTAQIQFSYIYTEIAKFHFILDHL